MIQSANKIEDNDNNETTQSLIIINNQSHQETCDFCSDSDTAYLLQIKNCSLKCCSECLFIYAKSYIMELSYKISDFIRCPCTFCKEPILISDLRLVLASEQNLTIQTMLLRKYCFISKDIFNCPNKDCNYFGFLDNNISQNENQNQNCQQKDQCVTCENCQAKWTPYSSKCFKYENMLSVLKKSISTKQCPACRGYISKNGGCMHITCDLCKFQFCWSCGQEWESHLFILCYFLFFFKIFICTYFTNEFLKLIFKVTLLQIIVSVAIVAFQYLCIILMNATYYLFQLFFQIISFVYIQIPSICYFAVQLIVAAMHCLEVHTPVIIERSMHLISRTLQYAQQASPYLLQISQFIVFLLQQSSMLILEGINSYLLPLIIYLTNAISELAQFTLKFIIPCIASYIIIIIAQSVRWLAFLAKTTFHWLHWGYEHVGVISIIVILILKFVGRFGVLKY